MFRKFEIEPELEGFDFCPLVKCEAEFAYRRGEVVLDQVHILDVLGMGNLKIDKLLEPRHWTAITEQALDFAYENENRFEAELEAM